MLALQSIDLRDRNAASEIEDSACWDLEGREIAPGWEGGRLALGHLGAHIISTRHFLRLWVCHTFANPFLRADLVAIFHGM